MDAKGESIEEIENKKKKQNIIFFLDLNQLINKRKFIISYSFKIKIMFKFIRINFLFF